MNPKLIFPVCALIVLAAFGALCGGCILVGGSYATDLLHTNHPDNPSLPDVIGKPSRKMLDYVKPIQEILNDKKATTEDRENLFAFYRDFADIIERDEDGEVKSTDQLERGHVKAGKLMFQKTGMKDKYDGLAKAVNNAIAEAIGNGDEKKGREVIELTGSQRNDAVKVLEAISWACKGEK